MTGPANGRDDAATVGDLCCISHQSLRLLSRAILLSSTVHSRLAAAGACGPKNRAANTSPRSIIQGAEASRRQYIMAPLSTADAEDGDGRQACGNYACEE